MRRLTKAERRRRSLIVDELSRLSRGGWVNARCEDWETLECELRALNDKEPCLAIHSDFRLHEKLLAGTPPVKTGEKR